MLKFLLSIALKKHLRVDNTVDSMAIGNWLFNSYKDKGFTHYNTARKKMINNFIATGLEQKEYWIAIGRIKELQALGVNIEGEFSRRNKKNKKE